MDETDRLALEAPLRAQIEGEVRQEIGKTINVFLACAVDAIGAAIITRAFTDIPRFAEVFEHVKVPMPTLTLLVLKHHAWVAILLGLMSVTCLWVTFIKRNQRVALRMNLAGLFVLMFWGCSSRRRFIFP